MSLITEQLTPEEKFKISKIFKEYEPLLKAAQSKADAAISEWTEVSKKIKEEKRLPTTEEIELSEKVEIAIKEQTELNKKWLNAKNQIVNNAKNRLFQNHQNNIDKILGFIKSTAPQYIASMATFAGEKPTEYERKKQEQDTAKALHTINTKIAQNKTLLKENPDNEELTKETEELIDLLNTGAYKIKPIYDIFFTDDILRTSIFEYFSPYIEFLKKNAPEAYKEACNFIEDCIEDKENIYNLVKRHIKRPTLTVHTITPKEHLATTDRVSNTAFDIENEILYTKKCIALNVERKGSKKEINTLLSISFDEMEKHGVQIDNKKLTPFDREVHDAIITLFVEGETDVMSAEMIYRTMIGKPKGRLAPKQAEAINQSITKMMRTLITIDASQEAAAYGFDSFTYKGNLIYAEIITASINNSTIDALHLLKEPVLYTYASKTSKIGRINMKLLDTPLSKNEETIVLQGYLYRRILAMKHGQSKTIVYDTIYRQLTIQTPTESALKKKKIDIRKKVRQLLNYWEKEKFIAGYEEKTKGKEIYSVTINF